MKRTAVLLCILALILAGRYFFKTPETRTPPSGHEEYGGYTYNRIVSLSPGITETLFALGAGNRVVGVTRFCKYPPEAQEKEEVGGYIDPNFEAIAALNPDLIFVLPEQEKVHRYLDELHLKFVTVRDETLEDILDSVIMIGKLCGLEGKAGEIITQLESRMQTVKDVTDGLPREKVLISVGRNPGTGSLEDVYCAGRNTLYDELITCAGGVNAYSGHTIAYPVLSAEGLYHLNPDIIIDLIPDIDSRGLNKTALIDDWQSIKGVAAVKNERVHLLSSDYAVIPGPRFILFLEDMARLIHPDATWETL